MKKDIIQTLKVLLAAIVLSLGISYVYAWTAPATTPPTGNTPAPLNEGATAQTKNGGLGVNAFTANSASFSGNVGIGVTNPTEKLRVNGNIVSTGTIQSNSFLRAPLFYDTDNTGYYVDPASTSKLNTTYINKIIFPDGSTQNTASLGNPVMIASGKQCLPQTNSTLWYPPAGWYNFTGTHSVVKLELNTSSGWGGGDNAGANAGTMWFDGSNMRIELQGQCVYWQKFNI